MPSQKKQSKSDFLRFLFKVLFLLLILFVGIRAIRTVILEKEEATTPTPSVTPYTYCKRDYISYVMEPRFKRALNLLLERNSEQNVRLKTLMLRFFLHPIAPCLDIQYCDFSQMSGADGLFFFSPETANRDRLLICVSKEYQEEDDLLTALLLAHEITHAIQFVVKETNTPISDKGIYKLDCFGEEAMAYTEEVLFMTSLTDGEIQSLTSRIAVSSQFNPRIASLGELMSIAVEAAILCDIYKNQDEFLTCSIKNLATRLEKMIRSDPFYQRQCSI